MALVLKGEAWYLRKQIGGERKDHPLRVFGGEANRKKAEKAAVTLERQLQEASAAVGVLTKLGLQPAKPAAPEATADAVTLRAWWTKYLEVYEPRKATRTQSADKARMDRWLELPVSTGGKFTVPFGDVPLTDIRQIHCMQAIAARRKQKQARVKDAKPVSESTVQRERILVQAVFERAVENDIITKNPWTGIDRPADVTRSDRLLSLEDEPKLFEAIRNPAGNDGNVGRAKPETYVRFVTFLVETGLRLDELLNKHFTDNGDHVSVIGKGNKKRDVPLTKRARTTLDTQKKEDGKLWDQHPTRFSQVLKKACQRADIPHISSHDLRHTFGHRFLVKGGDIYTLSKLLGHATVAVTEKHYAYLRREDIATKMLAVMDGDAA